MRGLKDFLLLISSTLFCIVILFLGVILKIINLVHLHQFSCILNRWSALSRKSLSSLFFSNKPCFPERFDLVNVILP